MANDYWIIDPWDGQIKSFRASYGDPKRYIFAIRCYRGKIPEEKYQLLKGGVILKEYDFNPEDKIKDLEDKIESFNEEMAQARLEVNSLREALETQERDNEDLTSQLNRARNERDNLKIELVKAQEKLEESQRRYDSLVEEKKALLGSLRALEAQIKGFEDKKAENLPVWKLILLGIGKILKRREKKKKKAG